MEHTRFSFTLKQFAEDLTNFFDLSRSSLRAFLYIFLQITVKIACAFCVLHPNLVAVA